MSARLVHVRPAVALDGIAIRLRSFQESLNLLVHRSLLSLEGRVGKSFVRNGLERSTRCCGALHHFAPRLAVDNVVADVIEYMHLASGALASSCRLYARCGRLPPSRVC